jgi:GntR family transcriptional regulator
MVTPSKRQAKYLEIAAELRTAIAEGEYAPDSRLPGENDLMATYQVARETARKALAQLINEGIATPRRGAGVFVRAFKPIVRNGIQRLSGSTWPAGNSVWADETGSRSLAVDDVQVVEDDAPSHTALLLGLDEDARVIIRSRRYVLDGKPVLMARSYLPAQLVSGSAITQPDTGPGGIYARLRDLGHAPTHFREELRARMPEPSEVSSLALAAGTPVVEVVRTAYTEDGTPVEVNEMVADASAYVFRYDFTAN